MKSQITGIRKILSLFSGLVYSLFPNKVSAQQLLYGPPPAPYPTNIFLGVAMILLIPLVLFIIIILGIIYFFKRSKKNASKSPQNRQA